MVGRTELMVISLIAVLICCSISVFAYILSGGEDKPSNSNGPGGSGGSTPNPCAGLTDDSPASSIPVACLRKHLKDGGCSESGSLWPQDDYNGWWRQNDGAGTYRVVKGDIPLYTSATSGDRYTACKGPS